MRAISRYLVRLSDDINIEDGYYEKNGIKIYMPTKQHLENKVVPQIATVIDYPKSNKYGVEKGDTIIMSRFIFDNYIDNDVRYINEKQNEYDNSIYGIIRGSDFVMVNGNLLVERVEEEHEFLKGKFKPFEAMVSYGCSDSEIKKGDKVYVFHNNITRFNILGDNYYLVRIAPSVPAYERDGEYFVASGWVEVEPHSDNSGYEETSSGLFVPSKTHGKKNYADVRRLPHPYSGELEVGDTIYYQRMERYSLDVNGEKKYYASLDRHEQVFMKVEE